MVGKTFGTKEEEEFGMRKVVEGSRWRLNFQIVVFGDPGPGTRRYLVACAAVGSGTEISKIAPQD